MLEDSIIRRIRSPKLDVVVVGEVAKVAVGVDPIGESRGHQPIGGGIGSG
jgi:hypothetical protein